MDHLLAAELEQVFMIGPFSQPPFPTFCISPLGIATRKYSGKKRIIIDLLAPHGSHVPSINSLIPSKDYSLPQLITPYPSSNLLAKTNGSQKLTLSACSRYFLFTWTSGSSLGFAGKVAPTLQSDLLLVAKAV